MEKQNKQEKLKNDSDEQHESSDEEYEEEEMFNFDTDVDYEALLQKYFYDEDKERNIVHVGIEIKRSIEKLNSNLNKLLEHVIKTK